MYKQYQQKGMTRDKRQGNYIKVGRNHIFLNFTPYNMPYVKDLLNLDHNQRIHIFISTPRYAGEPIAYLIREFADYDTYSDHPTCTHPHRKIVIHVPKKVKDLAPLLLATLNSEKWSLHQRFSYKIVIEKQGPSFNIPGTDQMLDVNYDDAGININVSLAKSKYEEYFFPTTNKHIELPLRGEPALVTGDPVLEGIILENRIMQRNPELFRAHIIANYKAAIPKRRLKDFHSDDELWNYLLSYINWTKENTRR